MQIKKLIVFLFFLIASCGFSQSIEIIPRPVTIALSPQKGYLTIQDEIALLFTNKNHKNEINFYANWLTSLTGKKATTLYLETKRDISIDTKTVINFTIDSILVKQKDGYSLLIKDKNISVKANNTNGFFYAMCSIAQLIAKGQEFQIPFCSIYDYPQFEWRGMHLDVSRHFFDINFVKKYIDLIALHKMNVFHWHLTDDQGWRIEIKRYPELTKIGSWRNGSMVGAYSDHKIDTIRYGGYYTQDEIKEIVNYANQRHVTIVPEIEMPGHSMAALAAYPQLACSTQHFEVAKQWGVFDDVFCAGNDETFTFIENILSEICELFPGDYIHIGGDECPKEQWKNCAKCQNRIQLLQLKDEHELQSYFIQRIEEFLLKKGKKIIGWDEILEGGLAPNAAVMSWRGTNGGIEAAKQKHKVIMTPGSHCYFDHYQGYPEFEPHAIGGYTTVQKVYNYNPIPNELKGDEIKYIMGAQGNVWTEYMLTEKHVEYMMATRLCALAEITWLSNEKKNENDFFTRLIPHIDFLTKLKYNCSKSFLQPEFNLVKKENKLYAQLKSPPLNGNLFYTSDNNNKVFVKQNDTLIPYNFNQFVYGFESKNNKSFTLELTKQFNINLCTGKPITFTTQPSTYYNHQKDLTLVNGICAKWPRINNEWNAWSSEDAEFLIDLEVKQNIKQIRVGYYIDNDNWIYKPDSLEIWISGDGKKFIALHPLKNKKKYKCNIGKAFEILPVNYFEINFKKKKTRFIKFKIKNQGIIKKGNLGEGNKSWIFLDEIQIN